MKKLLISEVFAELSQITGDGSKAKKVEWLRQNDSPTLRLILKHGLDPTIVYNLPEGVPPFRENNSRPEHCPTNLAFETRRLAYLWLIPGIDPRTQHDPRSLAEQAKATIDETNARLQVIAEEMQFLQRRMAALQEEAAACRATLGTATSQRHHATINRARLEQMYIEMLESLPKEDAHIVVAAKNKALKEYGITKALVTEAFPDLL